MIGMNNQRLSAPLTESLVLGALTHNLEWMELQGVSLKQGDFLLRDNQVMYSIMRDRLLEQNMEITAEQLMLEAKKHPVDNNVSMELTRNLRDKVGNDISFDTFKKEIERLNKLRILRDFHKQGFNTEELVGEDSIDAPSIIGVIDQHSFEQILNHFRSKVDTIEASLESIKGKTSITASQGLRDLIKDMQDSPQVGELLDGDLFNTVVRGALLGKYYLNSSPTGVGKTRMMLGNAAKLAYPRILENGTVEHRKDGYRPVLFITTEQTPDEIQSMLVAAISGIEEEDIKIGGLTVQEMDRLELAIEFVENADHFFIEQIPDPTVALVKSKSESHIRKHGVQYIFYDYIFGSPGVNSEFKSGQREDVVLMYLSNALKEIAAIHNVFVMSATQVNGGWMEAETRNQNLIRGSKAIVDKADVAMITLDIREEELMKIQPICEELGLPLPTTVTDIYKNRGGRYSNIKVFRYLNKGTSRLKDLFMTTEFHELITPKIIFTNQVETFTIEQARRELIE